MAFSVDQYLQAIKGGNVPLLRDILDAHPEYLNKALSWGGYDGFALNAAAFFGHPLVIEFLVLEKGVDINAQEGVGNSWTALHHAVCPEAINGYAAAEALIQLGADTRLKDLSGRTPFDSCAAGPVKELLQSYVGMPPQQGVKPSQGEGIWNMSSFCEVMNVRSIPGSGYRLTDIFNFETRRLLTITKDASSGHIAQSMVFFDDVPDMEILHKAHAKYKELGGKIGDEVINGRKLRGKIG